MSGFLMGNLLLAASMVLAAASHVMLKAVVNGLEPGVWGPRTLGTLAASPERLLACGAALGLLGVAFGLWLMSLSRLPLNYAYGVACSSVLLVTLFSVLFLNETVSARNWYGTVLIVLGIVLMTPRQG